jgi:betaine-aldehyde dehydrogenase
VRRVGRQAITTFTGQFCMTGSRVLVQSGIANELRARLSESLQQVRVGPGDDPVSDMGPMIDRQNVERVDQMVTEAGEYASILVRGGPVTDGPLAAGAFYQPTLIEVDDVETPIVQREVFGPVATFEVFDDEDEAIDRANATDFGLAAGIWTRDVDRPLRVGRELEAGTVWFNTWAIVVDQFEEGGFKQSGIGRSTENRGRQIFCKIRYLLASISRPVG